jgi:RHS repeat-associated protein
MSVELLDWFDCDWLNRRVATVTRSKGPGATAWTTVETRHFWYDGWNLMAETVASPPSSGATSAVAVTHRYAWGVDLGGTWETGMWDHGPGGSQTAAGGVGALLGLVAPNTNTYSATHDANGNVMGFIDLETGTLAARFDYDAFGTLITDWSAPGHSAWEISRIRFSGKYQDPHTGWLYYGYRYLDTVNGRWVSRDPIGEEGGLNLYGMCQNDLIGKWDLIGKSAHDAVATIKRTDGNPFGTYGTITFKAVTGGYPEFKAKTIELPYGRYNAGGKSGMINFPVKSSATGYLRRTANLKSPQSEAAKTSIPASILGAWAGPGDNSDLGQLALNSSLWQGQHDVYIHAGRYPPHSTFCVLVGTRYVRRKHLLSEFETMRNWPSSRDAGAGTLPIAMAEIAATHGGVNPEQFIWDEFDREDTLRTQFKMNRWIAGLECSLGKRGASNDYKNEPIMKIRIVIDDAGMNYSSRLAIFP